MSEEIVTIGVYENVVDAKLAQTALEAAGIRSFLMNEHTVGVVPLWSNAVGGIRLQVPRGMNPRPARRSPIARGSTSLKILMTNDSMKKMTMNRSRLPGQNNLRSARKWRSAP